MKLCALLLVSAVCAVLLPSSEGRPQSYNVATRGANFDKRRTPLRIAKLRFAKRDSDSINGDSDSDSDSYSYETTLAEVLESEVITELLAQYGITMQELNEQIEADDEIAPGDRDMIKLLAIMVLAGLGDSSEEDSSEESNMMF